MGILDKFTSLFAPRKTKVRVICVGLDNSGKSTVINYLKPKKVRCCRAPAPAAPAVLTLPLLCRVGTVDIDRGGADGGLLCGRVRQGQPRLHGVRHVRAGAVGEAHPYPSPSLDPDPEPSPNPDPKQGRYRNLWEHYYKDCGGIIFTIDSCDKIRMCVARDELLTLLNHADLKNAPRHAKSKRRLLERPRPWLSAQWPALSPSPG